MDVIVGSFTSIGTIVSVTRIGIAGLVVSYKFSLGIIVKLCPSKIPYLMVKIVVTEIVSKIILKTI